MPATKHLCETKNQRNYIIGSFMGKAFSLEFQISSPSSPWKKTNKAIHHPNKKPCDVGYFMLFSKKPVAWLISPILNSCSVKRWNAQNFVRWTQRSSSASTVFSRPVSGSGAAAVTIQGCFKPSFVSSSLDGHSGCPEKTLRDCQICWVWSPVIDGILGWRTVIDGINMD